MEEQKLDEIRKMDHDYVKSEYIDDDDVTLSYDTPLISYGYVDSFSKVSFLIYFENQFRIKIPPSKATPDAFDSVNKIVELLKVY